MKRWNVSLSVAVSLVAVALLIRSGFPGESADPSPEALESMKEPTSLIPSTAALAERAPLAEEPSPANHDDPLRISEETPSHWALFPWREVVWEDFRHPAILEAERNDRIFHAVANRLLVTLPEDGEANELFGWAHERNGRGVEDLGGGVFLLRWEEPRQAAYFIRQMSGLQARLGAAAYVEPDLIIRAASVEPNDPLYPSQHHFAAIHAPEGWAVRREAPEIVVAVLDSGVDRLHVDLVERVRPRPGEIPGNGIDDDGNGFIDDVYGWNFYGDNNNTLDFDGHGTHVAGIIGAHGNNAEGLTGVAWDVTLLPVRILDDLGRGTTSDEIRGLSYILASGVNLVSASYGGPGLVQASRSRHAALRDAGIWLVAAAGNESADLETYPIYPAAHGFETIITVAATDKEKRPAGFSNFGRKTVDVFAPGTGIWSTVQLNNEYGARSGSSQAAAVVTGALALVLAEYPTATRADIRSRIVDRARDAPALRGKSISGALLDLGHALAPGDARPPQITAQPQSVEKQYGDTVVLAAETVSSAGTEMIWSFNGEEIPGAHTASLNLGPLTEAKEGDYQLRVSDVFGEVTSAVATVTLEKEPPVLVRNSASATIVTGQTVELFIEVEGSPPQTIQWFRDGMLVPGATSARFVIPGADPSHAGDYTARVTSPWGTVETTPIPVKLDPALELSWHRLAPFPPTFIRLSGDVYFGRAVDQLVVSSDLIDWQPVDWPVAARGPDALVHALGAYWFVDLTGRLHRSTDLHRWDVWVELAENPQRSWSSWGLSAGLGRMIVRGLGQGYFLIDPVARTAAEHPDPGTFRSDETTSPSAIRFTEGMFYYSPSSARSGFRSTDGLNWTRVEDSNAILPIHVDDVTGAALGREGGSSPLYIRAPGGAWQPFLPFGEWVGPSSLRTFPGGFQAGSILHDFRNGNSWTVTLPGSTAPGVLITHYHDFEISLTARDEAGGHVFRVEHPDADSAHVIVAPSFGATTPPGNPAMIESGGRVYRYAQPHLYELLPSGEHVVRDELNRLAYVGTVKGEALFRNFEGHDGRFYRIDENGRFALVEATPVLSTPLDVQWAGDGFYASSWEEGVFWTSTDGRAWRQEAGFSGGNPNQAASRNGAWIAPRPFVDYDSEQWRVDIFRRPVESTDWELVFTREEEGSFAFSLWSAPSGFLIRVGERAYFSVDGLEWTSLLDHFTSIAETRAPQDGVFLVRGELTGSTGGQTGWYGSRSGTDWFATDPDIYPLARGAVAFRRMAGSLEAARLSRGDYRKGPVLAVEGTRLVREVPTVVEVEARIPDAARAVSVELVREGVVVGTINPAQRRFPITLSQPGVETFRVRVLYDDGWTTTSGDLRLVGILPLEVRKGRVFPPAGFEPPTFYIVSNERIFARRSMTGEVFTSTDGFEWTPFAGAPLDFLSQRRGYTAPDGTFFVVTANPPSSAALGWMLPAGANIFTQLPKPPGTQGVFGDAFLLEGMVHALMGNGKLYRLDGPGTEWKYVREPDGFPSSISPVGPDIRVHERDGWYLVVADNQGHLTRDFRQITPVAIPEGWSHHDGFIFVRGDRRAYALLEAAVERLRLLVETETPLTAFQDLGNGTYLATSGGVRSVVLPDGRLLPLDLPAGTFRHEGTTLLILSGNGDVRSVEANDFSVDSVAVTSATPGAVPSLGTRVGIGNRGLLGMGNRVSVNVRAWLESADNPSVMVALGDKEIDASGLVPGAARSYALRWVLPLDLPLGDYRLVVEVNADGRIGELSRANNINRSPVFAYNPEVALLVAPSRYGTVVADQVKASMPFGTRLNVEAIPAEGFRFLGWNGSIDPEALFAEIEMTRRHILHAHFVPARLHDALPQMVPLGTSGWYAEDGDRVFPLSADWAYSAAFGLLRTTEVQDGGMWIWAANHGWLWRPVGAGVYFDAETGEWSWAW